MAEKVYRLRMSRKTNPNDLIPHEVKGPGEAPAGMAPPPQGGQPPTQASGKGAGRGRVKIAYKQPESILNQFKKTDKELFAAAHRTSMR